MSEIYNLFLSALQKLNPNFDMAELQDIIRKDGFEAILHKITRNVAMEILCDLYRRQRIDASQIYENFAIDETIFLKYIADKFDLDFIDLDNIQIKNISQKIPINHLRKYEAIVIKEEENNVYIALKNPFNIEAKDKFQSFFDKKLLKIAICIPFQLDRYLAKIELNESIKDIVSDIRKELNSDQSSKKDEISGILKLVDIILQTAISSRASDIHIEPTQKECVVRSRIDGMLTETFVFDKDIFPPIASRIKLLANMNIAERRKPQDGRFSKYIKNKEYDFRVSTLPAINGESIVLRVLDKAKVIISLENLGMNSDNLNKFNSALKSPYGIVLVTGPTGSGKTTTLYGALNSIKNIEKKIITVEDPVEYQIPLIQQVHVNEKIDLTFANILRSILRQDPDIIMVGEIRDKETLQIAVQAALTGHLVLSTLHTNNAVSAVTRIVDMGIEPYLIGGSLIAIEAQRLVRKLCPHCKSKTSLPLKLKYQLNDYMPKEYQFYKHTGCQMCSQTGYLGREMISEILPISDKISSLIAANAPKEELSRVALEEGFISMLQDGVERAASGITTIEEVLRVVK